MPYPMMLRLFILMMRSSDSAALSGCVAGNVPPAWLAAIAVCDCAVAAG